VRSFEACVELVALLSPPLTLFKFPRTAHLLNLGAATEDDIVHPTSSSVFSAASLTPKSQIVITEKIDGANLGISLDSSGRILIQNRAHWVNSKTHFQFKKLDIWVEQHREALTRTLGADSSFPERYILFGEWMVCVHSIKYTRLPNRFLAFDLYDRSRKVFTSREVLEPSLRGQGSQSYPPLCVSRATLWRVLDLLYRVMRRSGRWFSSRHGSMTGGWRECTSRLRRMGLWSGVERS